VSSPASSTAPEADDSAHFNDTLQPASAQQQQQPRRHTRARHHSAAELDTLTEIMHKLLSDREVCYLRMKTICQFVNSWDSSS
jgi:hypothetical protein